MCNAENQKRSAKGSNSKEDDRAWPLYDLQYVTLLSLLNNCELSIEQVMAAGDFQLPTTVPSHPGECPRYE